MMHNALILWLMSSRISGVILCININKIPAAAEGVTAYFRIQIFVSTTCESASAMLFASRSVSLRCMSGVLGPPHKLLTCRGLLK